MNAITHSGCAERVVRLPVNDIIPASGQARQVFDQAAIEELAASIDRYGLLSPIVVRRINGAFQLIAGERRLRAVKLLGQDTVPAMIRFANEEEAALLGLIENLQREQLDYLEVAQGLKKLTEAYGFSQEALGRLLGMSQSCVANKLRLLRLSEPVCEALREARLTERHARALLKLENEMRQMEVIEKARTGGLSVRQTETLIERILRENRRPGFHIHLRDHRVLVNAVMDVVRNINQSGIAATGKVQRYPDRVEVLVTLPVLTGK